MYELKPVPVLGDNYVWLLRPAGADRVVVVDPGDARPVLEALAADGLGVEAVLVTHHHGDHVGGIGGLLQRHPAPVWGPAAEPVARVDHPVGEGDRVTLFDGRLVLTVLAVPGHTLGHVAYAGDGFALVGDTLFAGGCGRLFEGTPEQMYRSLDRLVALGDATELYCAHEYTAANLRFAAHVEPDNRALADRIREVAELRHRGTPTVPSTVGLERATNPFLRCLEPPVVAAAQRHAGRTVQPGGDTFAVVRTWKDGFR